MFLAYSLDVFLRTCYCVCNTSAWRPANLTAGAWFSLVLAGKSRGSTKLGHVSPSLFSNCIFRSCIASLKKPELNEMLDINPGQCGTDSGFLVSACRHDGPTQHVTFQDVRNISLLRFDD
jgi:hypothetical protein